MEICQKWGDFMPLRENWEKRNETGDLPVGQGVGKSVLNLELKLYLLI